MTGAAQATSDPSGVSFTLSGCRNDGTLVLPAASGPYVGEFICPDTDYTTGNLGKGWNELDLVPFRVTAKAGNSAPSSQTYAVAIAVDNADGGHPGFDVISSSLTNPPAVPPLFTLNTNLSDASCTAATVVQTNTETPGVGGTGTSLYSIVNISQNQNTTCVYDFYARLALGSHLFPGASLHADLLNQSLGTAGIGAKDVSIPVNSISPQAVAKTMSASEGGSFSWNLTKTSPESSVSFGDQCAANQTTSQPVSITVTWTKIASTPGNITVVANISATNPASRILDITVSDVIYKGTAQTTPLHTTNFPQVALPPHSTTPIGTDTVTLPNTDGNVGDYLNDVASGTYTDPATSVPVPGTVTFAALAQIAQGQVSGNTADIIDAETISGLGLSYSVATPLSVGNFTNSPTFPTSGEVDWDSGSQSSSGSITFNKTIYLTAGTVTSGTLSDTATLTPDGGSATSAGPVDISISSSANVSLGIIKTIPNVLASGDKLDVNFTVTRSNDNTFSQPETITFNGSCGSGDTCTSPTLLLTGLVPDTYTITETGNCFYPSGSNTCSPVPGLAPVGSNQQQADLTVNPSTGAVTCSATKTFTNAIQNDITAAVAKVTQPALTNTDPNFTWTFYLCNPDGTLAATTTTGAGQPATSFNANLGQNGTYTVLEVPQTNWVLTQVTNPDASMGSTGPSGSNTCTSSAATAGVCSFTVDILANQGATFTCTFTNTENGSVGVNKTVSGGPPPSSDAFTFELLSGADANNAGTVLETETVNSGNSFAVTFSTALTPNTHYQMCEQVMPGWSTNLPNPFVPGIGTAILPNPDVSNELVCSDFTVNPGQNFTFTVDNTPPPGGSARTIGFWKNWASCSKSGGHQAPVLDQTLFASMPGGILISAAHNAFTGYSLLDTTPNPGVPASDCQAAVYLLSKTSITGSKNVRKHSHGILPNLKGNSASDPAFGLAAQLLAAQLNVVAGAGTCSQVLSAINSATGLEGSINFVGTTSHLAISKSQAVQFNDLATTLDLYNNNLLCGP